MPFYSPSEVAKAKQMDLYTYLSTFEPQELVHFGGGTYCTREHDSLKISNGKWYWFSQNIGGRSALDYLIKVKGIPFTEAIQAILGRSADLPATPPPAREPPKRTLLLPEACRSSTRAANYLIERGIDSELIDFCIRTGRLYESEKYHNVVFVGQDSSGKPRYANLRGTTSDFKGEASGSDKRFSFGIPAEKSSGTLHVFESAIDLLSFATMCKLAGRNWRVDHMLSLAGVYRPRKELHESSMPLALTQFLHDHPGIRKIVLRLDNDYAGRAAAQALQAMLAQEYEVSIRSPPEGKDYSDCLCMRLGKSIKQTHERRLHNER